MALAVHLRDVVSLAGRFPLLSGASIDVAEGQVLHLRGPNGAGKSSLLRVLAGLVTIAAGEAEVLGHDLRADRRAVRREIGLVGHATFLYDDLSVQENLRFAVRASGAPVDRIPGAMERLGVDGRLASTAVGNLSAGQRRRCVLAVLLARSPRLWLLDEPHAGLDSDGQDLVDELIEEGGRAGATIVVASHDFDRVEPLAHRVVEIVGGRIVSEDAGATPATSPELVVPPHLVAGGAVEDEGGRDVA